MVPAHAEGRDFLSLVLHRQHGNEHSQPFGIGKLVAPLAVSFGNPLTISVSPVISLAAPINSTQLLLPVDTIIRVIRVPPALLDPLHGKGRLVLLPPL